MMARGLLALVQLLALATLLALESGVAFASPKSYVSLAFTRTEDEIKADTAEGKDEVQILNASFGYVQDAGLTLGLKYFQLTQNGDISATETGWATSGFGPMLGFYHQSGFFVNATYLLSPTKEYESGNSKVTYSGGNGRVLDIGKAFEMGAWALALQMSMSTIEYEKVKASTGSEQDLSGEWSDSSFYPYIAVFVFL